MTPLNLGDRPTDQPLPVHSVQRKFSSGLGAIAMPVAGTVLGSTDPMTITVTPPRRCFWVIEASILRAAAAGTWVRQDWGLSLVPTDLYGRTLCQCANGMEQGGNWWIDTCSTEYYLEANTAYTCRMISSIQAGNYYMADVHTTLFGYTIGDGVY